MHHIESMVDAHPTFGARGGVTDCLLACLDCATATTICADACLAESADLPRLVACIRLNQDCATLCRATAEVLARGTVSDRAVLDALLEACAAACVACANECEKHARHHRHCEVCAEACRACARACRSVTDLARVAA